jgi:hypothetical protein
MVLFKLVLMLTDLSCRMAEAAREAWQKWTSALMELEGRKEEEEKREEVEEEEGEEVEEQG